MRVALRLVGIACLLASGIIHATLVSRYQAVGDQITQGELFVVQAASAAVAAGWLLVRDHARVWLAGLLVMAGSLAAVLITYYVRVPAVGPLPGLYEPLWFPSKAWSAVAEGAFVLLAVARLARVRLRRGL
ncbi:MAG: hypothetical protein M3Z02_10165 [Actinomycetota bacterium]|nr:hypothetical protein [Actinomycetota bacterium]